MTEIIFPPVWNSVGASEPARISIELIDADGSQQIGWDISGSAIIVPEPFEIRDTEIRVNLIPQSRIGVKGNTPSWYLVRIRSGKSGNVYIVQVPDSANAISFVDLIGAAAVPAGDIIAGRLLPNPDGIPDGYGVLLVNGSPAWVNPSLFMAGIIPGSPNGYVDRSQIALSWDNINRTITISPVGTHFDFYANGVWYRKTQAIALQIANTDGNHFVHFNDFGEITEISGFDANLIRRWCWIAAIYWNSLIQKAVPDAFVELHGADMASATHEYLHKTIGTAYQQDGGILPSAVIYDGDGSIIGDLQITVTTGVIHDEDIAHIVAPKLADDVIPVIYLSGSGLWTFDDSSSAIVRSAGSGRAAYNTLIGGIWQMAEADNNAYVFAHLYAIPGLNHQLMIVMGRNQYSGINNMRKNAALEIGDIKDINFLEFKALATFAIQTSNSFSNEAKSRIVSIDADTTFEDWRYSEW